MKKEEFLTQLRFELRGLEAKDIDEIIRDQEEFIRDAVSAGRSEEDVVASFGTPKSFADSLKLEYKVNRINNAENMWDSFREVFGTVGILIALAPLNLILFFGPVIAILSFLFSWLVSSGVIVVVGSVFLLASFIVSLILGFTFVQSLAAFFMSVSIVAFGLCGIAIFALFTKLFIKIFIVYAQWNMNLINGRRA